MAQHSLPFGPDHNDHGGPNVDLCAGDDGRTDAGSSNVSRPRSCYPIHGKLAQGHCVEVAEPMERRLAELPEALRHDPYGGLVRLLLHHVYDGLWIATAVLGSPWLAWKALSSRGFARSCLEGFLKVDDQQISIDSIVSGVAKFFNVKVKRCNLNL